MERNRQSKDSIRWRLRLAASPATVFRLLTTDAGRRRFWAKSTEQHDRSISFLFPGGETLEAEVVTLDPPQRFSLRYFGGSLVSFELTPDGRCGTDLNLQETGVPAEHWPQNHAGWVAVLLGLKAVADFRIDLRNHEPGRSWSQGYVDG